jgi:hypothetical protein
VHRRYHPLRLFLTEFLRWQAESAHRIPPLLVLQNEFGRYAPRDSRLLVFDDAQASLARMNETPLPFKWLDPLQLHDRWKPQFMTLCEKLCLDLEQQTAIVERAGR